MAVEVGSDSEAGRAPQRVDHVHTPQASSRTERAHPGSESSPGLVHAPDLASRGRRAERAASLRMSSIASEFVRASLQRQGCQSTRGVAWDAEQA
eukprot:1870887-Rhodomonas_salina.3